MHCPFCQTPTQEDTLECNRCGFSLPKLDAIFGEAPQLKSRVTDDGELLSKDDQKRLATSMERFHQRYPQIGFHLWLGRVDEKVPLHLWMFWLFNRGNLPTRGGISAVNREIFLGIDTANKRAVAVTGYGLEPFLGNRHLAEILDKAQSELSQGAWRKATQTVLEQLSDTLTGLHAKMRTTYGAMPEEMGLPDPTNRQSF
jgi:hypothetical protein